MAGPKGILCHIFLFEKSYICYCTSSCCMPQALGLFLNTLVRTLMFRKCCRKL